MTKAIAMMNDTEFNRFARRSELNDLHQYLRRVAESKQSRVPFTVNPSNYMDSTLIARMDLFASEFVKFIDTPKLDYLKQLEAFKLYSIAKGRYEITLVYPTSKLTFAKKVFTTLGNNKCQLKELRGRQRDLSRYESVFFYEIECSCITRELINGGVYNVALLVYTLLKLGK